MVELIIPDGPERDNWEDMLYRNDAIKMALFLDSHRNNQEISGITDPHADKSNDLLRFSFGLRKTNPPKETLSQIYHRLTPTSKAYFPNFVPTPMLNQTLPVVSRAYAAPAAGRRRTVKQRFKRCVMKVGLTKGEGAAIPICVRSVLNKRGLTLKRFSKKGVVTQKLKPSKR